MDSDSNGDRRWALRRAIDASAQISNGAGLCQAATITDLSEEGCMVRVLAATDLPRDCLYTISVSGLAAFSGYLVWAKDDKAGFALNAPLQSTTVQSAVVKSYYAKIARQMAEIERGDRKLADLPQFPFD